MRKEKKKKKKKTFLFLVLQLIIVAGVPNTLRATACASFVFPAPVLPTITTRFDFIVDNDDVDDVLAVLLLLLAYACICDQTALQRSLI